MNLVMAMPHNAAAPKIASLGFAAGMYYSAAMLYIAIASVRFEADC